MQHLSLTLATLPENLALDEALLLEAEEGQGTDVLRFWHWQSRAVVLGAGGVVAEDVDLEACRRDAVPIFRRSSGGGTVLLGPGCLLFSLILNMERRPELQQIGPSYRFILGQIAEGLRSFDTAIEFAGTSDLAVAGRKFSGNSQQRKRHFLLHHGTILHGMDLSQFGKYLKLPERRPEYRGERSHEDFLTNLPADPEAISARMRSTWHVRQELRDWPKLRVEQRVAEQYAHAKWIFRR
ncbi:MAG TPA: lipoate--protein ligase family protein [Gemmataceae bacterium]|nr:lipoate--protein ligase family protein [Gemmataceae bacterium]